MMENCTWNLKEEIKKMRKNLKFERRDKEDEKQPEI